MRWRGSGLRPISDFREIKADVRCLHGAILRIAELSAFEKYAHWRKKKAGQWPASLIQALG